MLAAAIAWVLADAPLVAQDTRLDQFRAHQAALEWSCHGDRAPMQFAFAHRGDAAALADKQSRDWKNACKALSDYLVDARGTKVSAYQSSGGDALDQWLQLSFARTGDLTVNQTLALLALDLANSPALEAVVIRRQSLAQATYRSVATTAGTPEMLRACFLFNLSIGDLATARYCAARGRAIGADSSWYLIRLSWIATLHGDPLTAVAMADSAVTAAHDSMSIHEMNWYAQFVRGGSMSATRTVVADWYRATDTERVNLFRTTAAGNRPFAQSLTTAELDPGFIAPLLRMCPVWPVMNGYLRDSPSFPCRMYVDRANLPLTVRANLHHLWNPATGEPVSLIAAEIARPSLGPAEDAVPVEVSFREWDDLVHQWRDTTVHPRSGLGGAPVVMSLLTPASGRPVAWSLAAHWQAQRGVVSVDGVPQFGSGEVMISDLILGNVSQHLAQVIGTDTVVLAPRGVLVAREPATLFYQVRSDVANREVRVGITLRRIVKGSIEPQPLLSIGGSEVLQRGISAHNRVLSLVQVGAGNFQLELRISTAEGVLVSSQVTNIFTR